MNTAAKQAELAVLPSAYQRTHKLAMSAHTAVTAFGGHLQEAVEDIGSVKREQVEIWQRMRADREQTSTDFNKQLEKIFIVALGALGCSVAALFGIIIIAIGG